MLFFSAVAVVSLKPSEAKPRRPQQDGRAETELTNVAPSAGFPNPEIVPERAGEAQAAVAQPVGAAPPAHNYNPEQDHEAQMDAAQPIGVAPHHHAPEQDHGSVMDSSSHQTDDDSADSADRVDDKCEKFYTNYVSKVEKSRRFACFQRKHRKTTRLLSKKARRGKIVFI